MLACSILTSFLLIIVACSKKNEESKVPDVPTGLSVTFTGVEENGGGGYLAYYSFSWNEVKNADYYELYYSKNSSGPYEMMVNYIYGTNREFCFIEGSIDNDMDRYVKVKAVNEEGSSSLSSFVHCHYSYNGGGNGGGGNGGGSSTISAPTGVSADVSGSKIYVTWNSVSNASSYRVYRSSSSNGSYSILESTSSTYYYDFSPNTNNYYKVTAVNSSGSESEKSDYAYCYYSNGGGVPDAPTGVEAHDNSVVGETWVLISWNSVSNATSYKVYRSSSANGSYSLITTTEYTSYNDKNPMNGSNYYKVKAVNNAGESSYSSYAYYNNTPTVYSPCPVTYTSHTASSYQITLRWSNPTTSGCGTPTTAYLRVLNPDSGDYATLETMSGSASSVSFSYGMWANSEGYVYCGIITENSAGTSGGVPLVYNWKTDTWYGGKGLELTEEMEKEWYKFSK